MYQILIAERIRGFKNNCSLFSYYLEVNEDGELVPFTTNDVEVLEDKISSISKEKPLDMILPVKPLEICSDLTVREIVMEESEQEETDQGNADSEEAEEDKNSDETGMSEKTNSEKKSE